jgi:hypothetical protein
MPDPVIQRGVSVQSVPGGITVDPSLSQLMVPQYANWGPKAARENREIVAREVNRVLDLLEGLPFDPDKKAIGFLEHAPVKYAILAPASAWILNRTRPNPLTGISKLAYLFPAGIVFNALVDPGPANTTEETRIAEEAEARAIAEMQRIIPVIPPMWTADP